MGYQTMATKGENISRLQWIERFNGVYDKSAKHHHPPLKDGIPGLKTSQSNEQISWLQRLLKCCHKVLILVEKAVVNAQMF